MGAQCKPQARAPGTTARHPTPAWHTAAFRGPRGASHAPHATSTTRANGGSLSHVADRIRGCRSGQDMHGDDVLRERCGADGEGAGAQRADDGKHFERTAWNVFPRAPRVRQRRPSLLPVRGLRVECVSVENTYGPTRGDRGAYHRESKTATHSFSQILVTLAPTAPVHGGETHMSTPLYGLAIRKHGAHASSRGGGPPASTPGSAIVPVCPATRSARDTTPSPAHASHVRVCVMKVYVTRVSPTPAQSPHTRRPSSRLWPSSTAGGGGNDGGHTRA